MKKSKTKPAEGRNEQPSDNPRRRAGAREPQPAGDGLTCNEAQVEALLSEGEST